MCPFSDYLSHSNVQGTWSYTVPQDIILTQYIYDIILVRPGKQEAANTLNVLMRYIHAWGKK